MIWSFALFTIQSGKRMRCTNWAPGNYCELRDDIRDDIIKAKRFDPLRKHMPFEFIVGRGPGVIGGTFQLNTYDTLSEWELYDLP